MGSVSFDRAAEYYDDTRTLGDATLRALMALAEAELAPRGRCLEIGIGTGRIAVPVARTGIDVTGVDISAPMLHRLAGKVSGLPIRYAVADATALPFPDAAFGSVVAAHVLHLVGDWRATVNEVRRVVRPGGALLVNLRTSTGVTDHTRDVLARRLGHRDPARQHELDEQLDDVVGTRPRTTSMTETWVSSPERIVREFVDGIWSWSWRFDASERRRAADAARGELEATYGDLRADVPAEATIQWRVYDL